MGWRNPFNPAIHHCQHAYIKSDLNSAKKITLELAKNLKLPKMSLLNIINRHLKYRLNSHRFVFSGQPITIVLQLLSTNEKQPFKIYQ